MKKIYLFLGACFIFILNILFIAPPISFIVSIIVGTVIGLTGKDARKEWRESKPGYVPPVPKEKFRYNYDYSLPDLKSTPKPKTKEEELEETLKRLRIKYKINSTDSSGPR